MNKLSLFLILLLLLVVGGAGYGYSEMKNQLDQANDIAMKEKALREINVKNSTLSKETEFIFARITNQYTYYYDKTFLAALGISRDTVKIIYEWPYTFSFGIKIPDAWDWCIKEVDGEPGYVQVNSPFPSFISSNPPNPKEKDIINGSAYAVNDQTRSDEMAGLALQRVNADANQYLNDENVQKNIRLAFSKHLQDVMNISHKNSNPVAGVKLNYVENSGCK